MTNIPQHVVLRELGGCISFVPIKRKRRKDTTTSDNPESSFHNDSTRSNSLTKSNIGNDFAEQISSHHSTHPKINSNIVRQSYKMLKHLISSNNRYFHPVDTEKHPIASDGAALGVTYADGKMFIRNRVDKTYDCFAVRERNKKLYSLCINPKWEDVAIVAHSSVIALSKPVIIILRKGNTIHIHDLESGNIVKEIDLGTSNNVKNLYPSDSISSDSRPVNYELRDQNNTTYKELFYDFETSQVCVKSTRNPKSSDILVSFVLFSYPDVKDLIKVNIRRSVFGSSITDAEIFQDIVMIMVSGSLTRLYSLQSLLKYELSNERNGTLTNPSRCSQFHADRRSLQRVVINEKLPCLYDIKSFQHNVQLSPVCGMKTIIIGLNDHNFKLLNLNDNSLVNDGMVGMRDPEGINHFRFHPDESSRLIYLHPPRLSVYEIEGVRSRMDNIGPKGDFYKVHKTFDFQVAETTHQPKPLNENLYNESFKDCYRVVSERDIINFHSIKSTENKISNTNKSQFECNECGELQETTPSEYNTTTKSPSATTKSGRKVVQRIPTLAYDDLIQKRNYVTYDYEDELDILVLLTYNDFNETFPDRDDDEDFTDTQFSMIENIILLDNTTYQVLKRVPINEVIKENKLCGLHDVSVTLDRDILLIKHHSGNQTKSFLYSLCSK